MKCFHCDKFFLGGSSDDLAPLLWNGLLNLSYVILKAYILVGFRSTSRLIRRTKLRSPMNTNTLGLISIHMVTLSHVVKGNES